MHIANWPDKVNNDFNLESDWGYESDYTEEIKFESGKKRIHLKNSYVPLVYSLSLDLGNDELVTEKNTELQEFKRWFEIDLRHGIYRFYVPRINYKQKWYVKTGEMGIYRFIPGSLKFVETDGLVPVNFDVEELGWLPEIEYIFLATHNDEILFTGNGLITVN